MKGRMEVVILRPGIVFGPRERWVFVLANELMKGTTFFQRRKGNLQLPSIWITLFTRSILRLRQRMWIKRHSCSATRRWYISGFFGRVADGLNVAFSVIHQVRPRIAGRTWRDQWTIALAGLR